MIKFLRRPIKDRLPKRKDVSVKNADKVDKRKPIERISSENEIEKTSVKEGSQRCVFEKEDPYVVRKTPDLREKKVKRVTIEVDPKYDDEHIELQEIKVEGRSRKKSLKQIGKQSSIGKIQTASPSILKKTTPAISRIQSSPAMTRNISPSPSANSLQFSSGRSTPNTPHKSHSTGDFKHSTNNKARLSSLGKQTSFDSQASNSSGYSSNSGVEIAIKDADQELEEIKELTEAFHLADRNGDNTIDSRELLTVMRNLGHNPSEMDILEMMTILDIDGNGKIELHEFIDVMMSKFRLNDTVDDMRNVFKVFDRDGNGFISRIELKHMLTHIGGYFTEHEVDEILCHADLDGDGQLNYDEFIRVMME